MNKNTSKIIELAKNKSEQTKNKVIEVINEMLVNGEKITFYSVYKRAGVSKSYVYKNEEVRLVIETYRKSSVKKKQGNEAKDVIIEAQKKKIKELERKIKELKKSETYKEKYERLLIENKELKKQLENAYTY